LLKSIILDCIAAFCKGNEKTACMKNGLLLQLFCGILTILSIFYEETGNEKGSSFICYFFRGFCISSDINGDRKVDFTDFAIIILHCQQEP